MVAKSRGTQTGRKCPGMSAPLEISLRNASRTDGREIVYQHRGE